VRLVFVTQELDPTHAALAQSLDLVSALSARVDELIIVTRDLRWDGVPPNATVRTFEARGKPLRVVRFERALAASMHDADAVLVHMVPQFALLSAPLARAHRVPLALWYTHWNASRALRLATHVVDSILSVDRSSFPLADPKVRGIGHAIDVDAFAAGPVSRDSRPTRLLALGRTARWKGLGTLLEAFLLAVESGMDATLEIRGPSLTDDERAHLAELASRIAVEPRLHGRVELHEPIARAGIPALLSAADVIVSPNEPRSGSTLDKAVLEAAACARPVVTTNASLGPLLEGLSIELLAPPHDPPALAAVLNRVTSASDELLSATGVELRRRIVANHSLDHWADTVVGVMRELGSSRG
jgi:glycosyltransferase involved in cell wall biosynthesis